MKNKPALKNDAGQPLRDALVNAVSGFPEAPPVFLSPEESRECLRRLHEAETELATLRAEFAEARMQALADFGRHQVALEEVAALRTALTAVTQATTLLEAARIARDATRA